MKGRDAPRLTRRALRSEARAALGRYPMLALPLLRLQASRDRYMRVVGQNTQIVIDGFPRSANTFAVIAFGMAQSDEVEVAHHVHLPAQILAAVKARLPTMLLIREPEEVVTSLVLRFPHISLAKALKRYVRFYRPLTPYRGAMVVADFRDVASDYGSVIRRVNEAFGTRFAEFRHTPEGVAECLTLIEDWDRGRFGSGEDFDRRTARPSPARASMKLELLPLYRSDRLTAVREEAERLYQLFTSDRAPT
jgi:hypothetical protein